MFSCRFTISPFINSDFTISPLHHLVVTQFNHFTMRIEIYCWICWNHFTITHYSCFLKQVILLLYVVRTNPLWQKTLKKGVFKSKEKGLTIVEGNAQAKEKVFAPVEGVLASYHHFTISLFFFFFFWSGLQCPKAYSLWGGVVPSPSIG